MKGFKKFIAENHPDPDSVFGFDNYDFEQIMILAEAYKDKEVKKAIIKLNESYSG